MTPFLDLQQIAIDTTLVHYLPPGLARFYEALPVAREGDCVTIAMSHPENVTALSVLTQLFRAEIVPIRTDGAAVRAALQQIYTRESAVPQGVLAWLPAASQPAWSALLAESGLAESGLVDGELPVTWLDATQVELPTVLAAAQGSNYQLMLCAQPDAATRGALLREVHAPLWMVPAQPVVPQRILLVLRGFASDEIALTWVMQLAERVENPRVALLPLIDPAHRDQTREGHRRGGAISYLHQPADVHAHITDCALRLAEVGIQTTLTMHSGEPAKQGVQAMRQGAHDLMIIAAEGHGQFVGQLMAELEEKCTMPLGGVLVLKPSHEQTQRRP